MGHVGMTTAKKKLGRKKRFLLTHPYCCFCGGTEPSTTIDHVPPKACFPDGYWPEEFEFPACETCNQGSKRDDQLTGFYTQLLDFNESNRTPQDAAKMTKLRDAIARNYPDALPDSSTSVPIHQVGSIITPSPVAVSVQRPTAFAETMETLQRKLTHALYYRETGKPLTQAHPYLSEHYQIQGSDHTLTKYLGELLPDETIGGRTNVKNYGDPRHLGAEIGFFSVLHSWNQRLQFHPHVHCVLAAGGLAPDHLRWVSARRSFFLPIAALSRVFRGKFVAALRNACHRGELQFHGSLLPLAQPRAFAAWLRVLFRHDWVVYSKRPFGGPEHVLRYLGAYTHRVAISNSRLVTLADGNVTFRWRDSAHGNRKRLMTLPQDEFLRRFLLHLLPPGFVRIRNFGFLANRRRATLLPLCLRLLGRSQENTASPPSPSADQAHSLWSCPICGGIMRVVERLSAAQLLLRSPPHPDRCAA